MEAVYSSYTSTCITQPRRMVIWLDTKLATSPNYPLANRRCTALMHVPNGLFRSIPASRHDVATQKINTDAAKVLQSHYVNRPPQSSPDHEETCSNTWAMGRCGVWDPLFHPPHTHASQQHMAVVCVFSSATSVCTLVCLVIYFCFHISIQ
jgi:hypothetical protein